MKLLLPALVPALLFSLPACRGTPAHEEHESHAKTEAQAEVAEKEEAEEAEGAFDLKQPATSLSVAVAKALEKVPGGRVLQAVVENEDGKTICSIVCAAGAGQKEVNLDAGTGEVLGSEDEQLADESKELLAALDKDPAHPPVGVVQAIEAAVAKVPGSWALAVALAQDEAAPIYDVYIVDGKALKRAVVSCADGSVQKIVDATFEDETEGAEEAEKMEKKEKAGAK